MFCSVLCVFLILICSYVYFCLVWRVLFLCITVYMSSFGFYVYSCFVWRVLFLCFGRVRVPCEILCILLDKLLFYSDCPSFYNKYLVGCVRIVLFVWCFGVVWSKLFLLNPLYAYLLIIKDSFSYLYKYIYNYPLFCYCHCY